MPVRDVAHDAPQVQQVALRGIRIRMHVGLHLDLGLQHLAAEAFAQGIAAGIEEPARHVAKAPAVAADKEVLLFQAEGIRMRCVRAGMRHCPVIARGK